MKDTAHNFHENHNSLEPVLNQALKMGSLNSSKI